MSESATAAGKSRRRKVLVSSVDEGSKVVRHGCISAEDADKVFLELLTEWGISQSTETTRLEVYHALAELGVYGTSVAATLEESRIVINSTTCPLSALSSLMVKYTSQPNPIKVFYRSFRNAEIPITMFNILSTVENVRIRATVQMRYGIPMDEVPYAFDMFEDAAPYLGLTTVQIQTANKVKAVYLSVKQQEAYSKNGGPPAQDVSNRANGSTAKATTSSPVSTAAPITDRLNFSSLR
jgi:hypothetical protein